LVVTVMVPFPPIPIPPAGVLQVGLSPTEFTGPPELSVQLKTTVPL
jgi:hypothetical protein